MSDGWWNENDQGVGDYGGYNPAQTATAQNGLDPNTVYSPPGEAAPIDQYNYVPDPNAAGGYQTYGPGQVAPISAAAFSNTTGQYPNDGDLAQSISNNIDLTPTITANGDVSLSGFGMLPQNEQDIWNNTYGTMGAPYQWGQQSGNWNVPAGAEGFNGLPADQQNIWYGTYGAQAPQIWAQQAGMGGASGSQNPFFGYYPQSQGGQTVAPSTPGTIGAGTAGIQYGYGVPYFGGPQQQINPGNLPYLSDPNLAPGYIPGSGTYNQFNLSNPTPLFGTIPGGGSAIVNQNYGVGGPGDPTNGLEAQTPQQWIQGDRLFSWDGNMGQVPGTEGMGFIATLFGRGDTPSGISTAAWSAPQAFWDGLYSAINKGIVKPSARGWQFLQQVKGQTPQSIGGAAPAQAQGVGVGAGGAGGTNGPMGPGTQAFNYQAAYLDYMTARMNQLEIPTMNQLNDRERDKLAFDQAKQKWLEQYQSQVFGEGQRQFNEMQGIRQGQLTGYYNGQQTLAGKALDQETALKYLGLLGQLRGPGDIFQYLKVLNGTPGGIRDVVNAAAGQYRMPTTGGATVNGYSNPSDIGTLLDQMNNPNYGQEGQNLNLPPPNQINALNLQRMTPAQQQALIAAYESAGYNPQDVLAIFRNSLPRYAQQQPGTGRINLFGR